MFLFCGDASGNTQLQKERVSVVPVKRKNMQVGIYIQYNTIHTYTHIYVHRCIYTYIYIYTYAYMMYVYIHISAVYTYMGTYFIVRPGLGGFVFGFQKAVSTSTFDIVPD